MFSSLLWFFIPLKAFQGLDDRDQCLPVISNGLSLYAIRSLHFSFHLTPKPFVHQEFVGFNYSSVVDVYLSAPEVSHPLFSSATSESLFTYSGHPLAHLISCAIINPEKSYSCSPELSSVIDGVHEQNYSSASTFLTVLRHPGLVVGTYC